MKKRCNHLPCDNISEWLGKIEFDYEFVVTLASRMNTDRIEDIIDILNEEIATYNDMKIEAIMTKNKKDETNAIETINKLSKIIEVFNNGLNIRKTNENQDNVIGEDVIILFDGFDDSNGSSIISDISDIPIDQPTYDSLKSMFQDLHNGILQNDKSYSNSSDLKKLKKKSVWGLRICYFNVKDNIYLVTNCFKKHDQNSRKHITAVSNRRKKWLNGKDKSPRLKTLINDLEDPIKREEIIAKNEEIYNKIINILSKDKEVGHGKGTN